MGSELKWAEVRVPRSVDTRIAVDSAICKSRKASQWRGSVELMSAAMCGRLYCSPPSDPHVYGNRRCWSFQGGPIALNCRCKKRWTKRGLTNKQMTNVQAIPWTYDQEYEELSHQSWGRRTQHYRMWPWPWVAEVLEWPSEGLMWGFRYAEVGRPCPNRWKGNLLRKLVVWKGERRQDNTRGMVRHLNKNKNNKIIK